MDALEKFNNILNRIHNNELAITNNTPEHIEFVCKLIWKNIYNEHNYIDELFLNRSYYASYMSFKGKTCKGYKYAQEIKHIDQFINSSDILKIFYEIKSTDSETDFDNIQTIQF